MKRIWKEYVPNLILKMEEDKHSKFYPTENCNKESLPSTELIKGNLQQIQQLMGIGFIKRNLL